MYRFCIIIILLITNLFPILSMEQRSNTSIIDSLISAVCKDSKLWLAGKDAAAIRLEMPEDRFSQYFRSRLINCLAGDYKIYSKQSNDSALIISAAKSDLELTYSLKNQDCDSIIREISLSYSFNALGVEGEYSQGLNGEYKYKDTLAYEVAEILNQQSRSYSKRKMPERNSDIYEDIIKPLVVFSSAVLTVILLFTIRSG